MWRNWTQKGRNKILDGFIVNPIAWLLVGLLAFAECGNYEKARDLRRVCELVAPHILTVPDRYATTTEQKIDNICLRHTGDDD
jgi:hypothetical protein